MTASRALAPVSRAPNASAVGRAEAEYSSCPGCGLVLPVGRGPEHAFVGASPACWERYGRLSRTMSSEQEPTPRLRRLIADT